MKEHQHVRIDLIKLKSDTKYLDFLIVLFPFQGQSFLIAALLLQMPEEQAFGVLVKVI